VVKKGLYPITVTGIEIGALLGDYAASSSSTLSLFRVNLSVPSSRAKTPLKMGPMCCPEPLVKYYHFTPLNIPEERRSYQHRGGSLKSRV
jgi:hypothetical protein